MVAVIESVPVFENTSGNRDGVTQRLPGKSGLRIGEGRRKTPESDAGAAGLTVDRRRQNVGTGPCGALPTANDLGKIWARDPALRYHHQLLPALKWNGQIGRPSRH